MELTYKGWYMVLFLLAGSLFPHVNAADNGDGGLSFSTIQEIARRTQRDMSRQVPIDQLTSLGVSLSNVVFERMGYTNDSLEVIFDMLDNGVETLLVDMYWNEMTGKWQLCPAPFPRNMTENIHDTNNVYWRGQAYRCQPSMTVGTLVDKVSQYVEGSNSEVDVNIIQLFFRLRSIHHEGNRTLPSLYQSSNAAFNALGSSSLRDTVSSLSTYIYTPNELSQYRVNYGNDMTFKGFYSQSDFNLPSRQELSFLENKRVLVYVYENMMEPSNQMYNITSSDRDEFFILTDLPVSISDSFNDTVYSGCVDLLDSYDSNSYSERLNNISLRSHFRYVADSPESEFSNDTLAQFIRCGYSPILNGSIYGVNGEDVNDREEGDVEQDSDVIDDILLRFLPLSFWSWNPYQPEHRQERANASSSVPSNSNDDQVAYQCVVMFDIGWSVGNCYNQYLYACQSNDFPNRFTIPDDRQRYFEAYSSNICPADYHLATPSSSIEMLGLISTVRANDLSNTSIWIDLNDITIANCYVSGGPYAECPYQRTISRSDLVRLVAPSFVVIIIILFLIFIEKVFFPTPILTSRKKRWKRLINAYNEKFDYEGVPS